MIVNNVGGSTSGGGSVPSSQFDGHRFSSAERGMESFHPAPPRGIRPDEHGCRLGPWPSGPGPHLVRRSAARPYLPPRKSSIGPASPLSPDPPNHAPGREQYVGYGRAG